MAELLADAIALAERGDVNSQLLLTCFYAKGIPCLQADHEKMMFWAIEAANRGSVDARKVVLLLIKHKKITKNHMMRLKYTL
jgi:hypothetical protein